MIFWPRPSTAASPSHRSTAPRPRRQSARARSPASPSTMRCVCVFHPASVRRPKIAITTPSSTVSTSISRLALSAISCKSCKCESSPDAVSVCRSGPLAPRCQHDCANRHQRQRAANPRSAAYFSECLPRQLEQHHGAYNRAQQCEADKDRCHRNLRQTPVKHLRRQQPEADQNDICREPRKAPDAVAAHQDYKHHQVPGKGQRPENLVGGKRKMKVH